MIIFALLAVPLTAGIILSTHFRNQLSTTGKRWPIYNGVLWFLPFALIATLVLPGSTRVFDLIPRMIDAWFRDFVFPVTLLFVVVGFFPGFNRGKLKSGDVPWFLTTFWVLLSLQEFTTNFQGQDFYGFFVVPLSLSLVFAPLVWLFCKLAENRGHWYILYFLSLLILALASALRNLWLFSNYIGFALILILLMGITVISILRGWNIADKAMNSVPPWRPVLHKKILVHFKKIFGARRRKVMNGEK